MTLVTADLSEIIFMTGFAYFIFPRFFQLGDGAAFRGGFVTILASVLCSFQMLLVVEIDDAGRHLHLIGGRLHRIGMAICAVIGLLDVLMALQAFGLHGTVFFLQALRRCHIAMTVAAFHPLIGM